MENVQFSNHLIEFMLDTAILAGIPLLVATATGLVVSLFQAITQIQDQTLSQTIKIAAISMVLISMSSFLTGPLMSSTRTLFMTFHLIVQ